MNEEQLQEIEERANAATPGKWEPVHANNDVRIWRDGCIVAVFPYDMPYYTTAHNADADAAFCIAARSDVPALIAEVRSLRAKLDAVPEYVDYRRGCTDWDTDVFSFNEWCERFLEPR